LLKFITLLYLQQKNFQLSRMSKNIFTTLFIAFSFFKGISQTQNPVTWKAEYKSVSATEGEILVTATIEKGWHTYSQKATEAGPIPTSFKFTTSKQFTLIGKTEESNAHEEYVKAFEAKIFVFHDKAEFKQKIKRVDKNSFTIPFKIEFMSCNDAMCLPPKTIDISVSVK
jgi:hypothetical protein